MKSLGYVLCFLLGILVGWGLSERLPQPPPRPAPTASSPTEARLKQMLDRARSDLVAAQREKESLENELREARGRSLAGPEPKAPAPPSPPASHATLPPEWLRSLKAVDNVRDLLAMDIPKGRDEHGTLGWVRMTQRVREILKAPEAQDRFLRDLPMLTPEELVKLWDVFWLDAEGRAGGFAAFGEGFGPRITRTLVDLNQRRDPDPQVRSLRINLLIPDARYLTDADLSALKQTLASDPEEGIRKSADRLPRR